MHSKKSQPNPYRQNRNQIFQQYLFLLPQKISQTFHYNQYKYHQDLLTKQDVVSS